jgi:hypothetical protein
MSTYQSMSALKIPTLMNLNRWECKFLWLDTWPLEHIAVTHFELAKVEN